MQTGFKILFVLSLPLGLAGACKKTQSNLSSVKILNECSLLSQLITSVDQLSAELGAGVGHQGLKAASQGAGHLLGASSMCRGDQLALLADASLHDIATIVGQELDVTFTDRDRSDLTSLVNQMLDYRSPPEGTALSAAFTEMVAPALALEQRFKNPGAPLAYVKDYTFASLLKLQLLGEKVNNALGAVTLAQKEGKDATALIQSVKENAEVLSSAATETLDYLAYLRTDEVPAIVRKWFVNKPTGGILQNTAGAGAKAQNYVYLCYDPVPGLAKGDLAAIDTLQKEGRQIPAVTQMRVDFKDHPVCEKSGYCGDCNNLLANLSDKLEKDFAHTLKTLSTEVDKIFLDPEMELAAVALRDLRDSAEQIANLPANKLLNPDAASGNAGVPDVPMDTATSNDIPAPEETPR